MTRVENQKQLSLLLDSLNAQNQLTNCYFIGDEWNELINSNSLYFYASGSNLLLFEYKSDLGFFKCYYFISDDSEVLTFRYEAPIVLEIPFRSNMGLPSREFAYLEKLGFQQHIRRDLMYLKNPNLEDFFFEKSDFQIRIVNDYSYAEQISSSLRETFDLYTGDLLTTQEVKTSIQNGELLGAFFQNQLIGFLKFYTKKNVSWIGHMTVFKSFHGYGIGKLLVFDYLKFQKSIGVTIFQHWVMSDNVAALKMYDFFGFTKMNKSSISLIKLN